MNIDSPSASSPRPTAEPLPGANAERALVIGGGGAAGNAWAIGVIAGLADAGVDVTTADLVVGTSSGSTAAVQITTGPRPAELYAAILEAPPVTGRRAGAGAGPAPTMSGAAYLDWSNEIIASADGSADMRRRMGAAALERDTSGGAAGARWHDVVAARLPGVSWPDRRVLITAVDARTGEPVVLDRDSGVGLVDAVAASTSPLVPYPIGEHRYLDGGYRRNENADLAAGYARVLVLSPFSGRSRMPASWGMDLAAQVAGLRAAGSRVETVFPDDRAGRVFDANALDPSTRPQAARGGYEQGRSLASLIGALWD